MPTDAQKKIGWLKISQAVPACPDISTIKMKISMEKWWNETDKQNIQFWCQPVCHKSHMAWLSFQTRPP